MKSSIMLSMRFMVVRARPMSSVGLISLSSLRTHLGPLAG